MKFWMRRLLAFTTVWVVFVVMACVVLQVFWWVFWFIFWGGDPWLPLGAVRFLMVIMLLPTFAYLEDNGWGQ